MTEEIQFCKDEAKEGMENALVFLEKEFSKIRAGKADPQILEGIFVDFYGTKTPLSQTANINVPDPKTIVIQPWDKSILAEVEKEILAANLGLTPQNTGEIIRINIPALTEERRKEFVKKAKNEAENAKISIRNVRRSANEEAKKLEKDGAPEDAIKKLVDDIQKLTDDYVKKIDDFLEKKEKDIMTI
ncbi:MAG TPA: ribosome recycling factor [Bacteroidetes bacterium]|nr:ribosome recycling factor [Bacteroidota bacterium]